MKTIYLKTPYFRQIKNKKTKFCVRLTPDVIQGEKIELRNAQQGIIREVTNVFKSPVDKVPWFVLDDLGFVSRQQFKALVFTMFNRPFLEDVWILELAV